MAKGIVFSSKQTGIKEVFSIEELKEKTFDDISHHLYEKLLLEGGRKTIKSVMKSRENILDLDERAGLIKFFYLEEREEIPIAKAEYVLEKFFSTGCSEFLFFVDVIGGDQSPFIVEASSHLIFLAHARELIKNPDLHGTWKIIEYEKNKFRLVKTLRDRFYRLLTVIIQPNAGYPQRPPMVKTIPRHKDPCFNAEGLLDYTIIKSDGRFTWEKYANGKNPLYFIFEELKDKYKLVF